MHGCISMMMTMMCLPCLHACIRCRVLYHVQADHHHLGVMYTVVARSQEGQLQGYMIRGHGCRSWQSDDNLNDGLLLIPGNPFHAMFPALPTGDTAGRRIARLRLCLVSLSLAPIVTLGIYTHLHPRTYIQHACKQTRPTDSHSPSN